MLRKSLISTFCVLNLAAALWMNRPPAVDAALDEGLSHLPPMRAFHVRYGLWLLSRWAHLAGLDNKWTMFSTLHRFDWWYVIKAKYPDGSEEVLPLPLQSERTPLEHFFFDFKEAKIHLNLYLQPDWRKAYARYLCRWLIDHRGPPPPGVIIYELHYQNIYPRPQAAALGTHREPQSRSQVIQIVECPEWRKKRPAS